MVPVDTETNRNLKIATQKTEVIYQSHNVMKDTITLMWFRNVLFCNLFSRRLLTWNSEYWKLLRLFFEYINALDRKNQWALFWKLKENPYQKYIYIYIYIYICIYICIYKIYIYIYIIYIHILLVRVLFQLSKECLMILAIQENTIYLVLRVSCYQSPAKQIT